MLAEFNNQLSTKALIKKLHSNRLATRVQWLARREGALLPRQAFRPWRERWVPGFQVLFFVTHASFLRSAVRGSAGLGAFAQGGLFPV